jgi:hypothetical protein
MSTIKSSAENLTLNADGANNDIKFQSNGVEKASIDQDGKLTASALAVDNITIDGTEIDLSSGDLTVDVAGRIILSADDNGEIRLQDGASIYGQFKDDDDRFRIESLISDKDMLFVGNDGGSEVTAMVLDMSEGGKAICYGGVALGGIGAANTLDDYEEGTWTPSYSTSGGSFTYDAATQGWYTKIGDTVHVHFRIYTTSVTAGSGAVKIQGLPFSTGATLNGTGSIGDCRLWGGDTPDTLVVGSNIAYLTPHYRAAANGTNAALQAADLYVASSAKNLIDGQVTYKI